MYQHTRYLWHLAQRKKNEIKLNYRRVTIDSDIGFIYTSTLLYHPWREFSTTTTVFAIDEKGDALPQTVIFRTEAHAWTKWMAQDHHRAVLRHLSGRDTLSSNEAVSY